MRPDSERDIAPALFGQVREIIEAARSNAARSVNTAQVVSNWLIGKALVEHEQGGRSRAGYGKKVVQALARRLQERFGRGYSAQSLWSFRQFFLIYPKLVAKILSAPRRESWKPGMLSADLSWTHYRALLRVERNDARSFFEIEAVKNGWSGRALERQIESLLFERLSKRFRTRLPPCPGATTSRRSKSWKIG